MNFDCGKIKTNWEKDNIILGIERAGDGTVIGPMVYVCVYWKEEYDIFIKNIFQFNDSRILIQDEIEKMYKKINDHPNIIRYETIIITSEKISNYMLRREKISFNKISYYCVGDLIKMTRNKKINIKKIFIKGIGSIYKYTEYLKNIICDKSIEINVLQKANSKIQCIYAASIIAKVKRDHLVKELGENYINFGTGYPNDPKTKEWLNNNYDSIFGYGREVRFSWKTIDNIFKEKGNECEWENYDSEEEERKMEKKLIKDSKQKALNFGVIDENKDKDSKKNDKITIKNTMKFINLNKKVRFYDENDIDVSVDF